MTSNLNDIAYFVNEKINIEELNDLNYISTENMLPDKSGITKSAGLPNANYTQSFSEGDILLSNIRPYFKKIWYATFNGGCSNDVLVLRAKSNVCSKFLYYVLSDDKFFEYDTATSKGTKMPRGDKVAIMKYSVPQYDLSTQEKIARVLSSLDDKIELNNKINQNLEQQAQAIFKSWFVDFEPFGGKMPDDWTIGVLKDVIDFYNGYAFKSKNLLNEPNQNSFAVFKQGHINRGGGFNISGTKSWIDKSNIKDLNKYILQKGDVLMAMTDMKDNVAILGNTAIMPFNNQYIVNQRVGLLRCNNDLDIKYPYVYIMTNSEPFLSNLRKRANSGVQVNLSSEQIKNSEIIIPSKNINQQYNKLTIPMFEIIFKNYTENKKLTQLRDTLLPKLMSGEIDVDKVEV